MNAASARITVSLPSSEGWNWKPGSVIQVAAAYTYTFITPMLRLSKGSVTLSTIATALEEV